MGLQKHREAKGKVGEVTISIFRPTAVLLTASRPELSLVTQAVWVIGISVTAYINI
ncbi:MAG: hypothetical protein RLZZ234_342 [Candidatus Parcubacteria bacterium]